MNKIFGLIALITLSTGMALAQTTSGDLVGTIKDVTGAVIPNAPVTVTNEATGVASTASQTSCLAPTTSRRWHPDSSP